MAEGGTLSIQDNATIVGDLQVSGTLNVQGGSSLVVKGNLVFTDYSQFVYFSTGPGSFLLQVQGTITFAGSLKVDVSSPGAQRYWNDLFNKQQRLEQSWWWSRWFDGASHARGTSDAAESTIIVTATTSGSTTSPSSSTTSSSNAVVFVQTVPVAQFQSSSGAFSGISAVPSAKCTDKVQNAVGVYSSQSLGVAITIQRVPSDACPAGNSGVSGSSLSTGAIVGIVVGTVVGVGILFTIGVLLFRRREINQQQDRFHKEMQTRVKNEHSVQTFDSSRSLR